MELEKEIKNSGTIPPRPRAIVNIMFTASWLDRLSNRNIRKYKITLPQYNILRILKGSPAGLCVLDIKNRMIDRSSNVSRLVEKLKEQEYIDRTSNQDDRRMVTVSITPKGLALVEKIGDEVISGLKPLPGNKLTDDELVLLGQLLDKFRE